MLACLRVATWWAEGKEVGDESKVARSSAQDLSPEPKAEPKVGHPRISQKTVYRVKSIAISLNIIGRG